MLSIFTCMSLWKHTKTMVAKLEFMFIKILLFSSIMKQKFIYLSEKCVQQLFLCNAWKDEICMILTSASGRVCRICVTLA